MVSPPRTWEDELLERVEAVGEAALEDIRKAGLTYQAEVKNCLEAYRDTVKDIINDYNEE